MSPNGPLLDFKFCIYSLKYMFMLLIIDIIYKNVVKVSNWSEVSMTNSGILCWMPLRILTFYTYLQHNDYTNSIITLNSKYRSKSTTGIICISRCKLSQSTLINPMQ